jgi:hypothetical protein
VELCLQGIRIRSCRLVVSIEALFGRPGTHPQPIKRERPTAAHLRWLISFFLVHDQHRESLCRCDQYTSPGDTCT